ncbi:unnamed protein product [Camellia sinensis]
MKMNQKQNKPRNININMIKMNINRDLCMMHVGVKKRIEAQICFDIRLRTVFQSAMAAINSCLVRDRERKPDLTSVFPSLAH